MVNVIFDDYFQKVISKIKDQEMQKSIKNKIKKIIEDPENGKPMRNVRKGTREVYISPYRLAYSYNPSENKIIFLDIYHKDEQ